MDMEQWELVDPVGTVPAIVPPLVLALVVVVVSVLVLRLTSRSVFAILPAMMGTAVGVYLGYFPIWVVGMVAVVSMAGIFVYSADHETPDDHAPEESHWVAYGQGLKDAYASKFGGGNIEFDKAVDQHVAIMENNGRGFTRAMGKDWLKRMRKFTEAR